jgi:hypothetical protein
VQDWRFPLTILFVKTLPNPHGLIPSAQSKHMRSVREVAYNYPMEDRKQRTSRAERSSGERSYSLRCFEKVWYDDFLTYRDLVGKDETPAVEFLNELDGVGNKLSLFLCNGDDSVGPYEADAIQRFCRNFSPDEVERGIGQAGSRRACWLDELNSANLAGEGNARACKNMLTAMGLLRCLRQPVREILLPLHFRASCPKITNSLFLNC